MVREYDKYGIGKFYNQYVIDATLADFDQKSFDEAHSADILHIHSRSDMVFKFREGIREFKEDHPSISWNGYSRNKEAEAAAQI